MKVFLTGPSSARFARDYLSRAAVRLRERGYSVFATHEGDWQAPPNPAARNRFDFEATNRALREADVLIAVLDGYTIDDTVAAHIGAFHILATSENTERQIVGILHDTRVARWDWASGDRTLAPQVRESILEFGDIHPNFEQALSALDEKDRL